MRITSMMMRRGMSVIISPIKESKAVQPGETREI